MLAIVTVVTCCCCCGAHCSGVSQCYVAPLCEVSTARLHITSSLDDIELRKASDACAREPVVTRAASLAASWAKSVSSFLSQQRRRVDGSMSGSSAAWRGAQHRKCLLSSDSWYRVWVTGALRELLSTVQGQPHAVESVKAAVQRKLEAPSSHVVLHFVGDHGVGKSLTADLISLAWSLHCSAASSSTTTSPSEWAALSGTRRVGSPCRQGDALLTISGASYGPGIDEATEKQTLVQRVTLFATAYPFGMVLVDDLSAMTPSFAFFVLRVFLLRCEPPELGARSSRVLEEDADATLLRELVASGVDVCRLLVVLTSDFGARGFTQSLSTVSEIEQLATAQLTRVLQGAAAAACDGKFVLNELLQQHRDLVRVVGFMPLSEDSIRAIVRQAVTTLPCADRRILAADIDPVALLWLVARAAPHVAFENGHAVRRMIIEDTLGPFLQHWMETAVAVDDVIPRLVVSVVAAVGDEGAERASGEGDDNHRRALCLHDWAEHSNLATQQEENRNVALHSECWSLSVAAIRSDWDDRHRGIQHRVAEGDLGRDEL